MVENVSKEEMIAKTMEMMQASLSPDAAIRKQAEDFIQQAQPHPGYLPTLLEISAMNQSGVDFAAAVQLGTIVEHHWRYRDEEHAQLHSVSGFKYIVISEADKEHIRENIVGKLYQ